MSTTPPPPTPPDARRITPDCQPVFPCWLWIPKVWNGKSWAPGWQHTTTVTGGFHYDSRATHWLPDQPTAPAPILCSSQASAPGEIPGGSVNNPEGLHQLPPTQPPAPLAGGTAVYPSTAPAEVAAGCKEGRPVSPATGEREAELRVLIQATHDKWQSDWNRIYDQHKTASAYKYRPVLGYPSIVEYILAALTPLLDRREAELETAKFATRQHQQYAHMMQEQRSAIAKACHEMEGEVFAGHGIISKMLKTNEGLRSELAALRTLVAKLQAALEPYATAINEHELNQLDDEDRDEEGRFGSCARRALALTPASIADELAAKDAETARLTKAAETGEETLSALRFIFAWLADLVLTIETTYEYQPFKELQKRANVAHRHSLPYRHKFALKTRGEVEKEIPDLAYDNAPAVACGYGERPEDRGLLQQLGELIAKLTEAQTALRESEAARATAQETIESLQDEIRELGERD